jgi:Domain of unknown function (DUF4350)
MAGALKDWLARHRIAMGLLAGVVLVACCVALVSRGAGSTGHPDPVGPTIYSKSAIGHAGFYALLEDMEIPVRASEAGSGAHVSADDVLVIAEPRTDPATIAEVRTMLIAASVVLVLPKRSGEADAKRPNWLGHDHLFAGADVEQVLHVVDPGGAVVRVHADGPWASRDFYPPAPTLQFPQLIRSATIQPLLAAPQGILIGQLQHGSNKVLVISDPDLIANFALARGNNASIAVRAITFFRSAQNQEVIFDEFVHGFTERPFHILGILFQFPFVLVTVQIALACGVLCWAASARFGAPIEPESPLAAGKLSLIETGASLLNRRGNLHAVAQRYFEASIRDAAYYAHAPRGLDVPGLLRWLSGSARTVVAPSLPSDRGDQAALSAAQNIFRWRNTIVKP